MPTEGGFPHSVVKVRCVHSWECKSLLVAHLGQDRVKSTKVEALDISLEVCPEFVRTVAYLSRGAKP